MQNFADQCLDMARSILSHNLNAINEDGTLSPIEGEASRSDEPGHVALAIGEYYRATGETSLDGVDLIDAAARCITAQTFTEDAENGLAYSALGLLSFGPAKDRNPVWERLMDPTREELDKRLVLQTEYNDHYQAFNIAKAVTRYSMDLSKKDETGKLLDDFIANIKSNSSAGFCDDAPGIGIGGTFDIYGILSFIFIRQALQLHGNIHLKERKLPSLRTFAEKYIKLLPDIVRADGLGWAYGRGTGAYGQMHCISIILQALRDNWIAEKNIPHYQDILRKLFHFFFVTFLDQEHGYLVIRDRERTTSDNHTTRMANFDAARYLSQWSRLMKSIGSKMEPIPFPSKTTGRFVSFHKNSKKEQGLFLYQDPTSGLHLHLPLMSPGKTNGSEYLAFPQMPGVFEAPVNTYVPAFLPELTFGDQVCIPAYYGKKCTTGLGLKKAFNFTYEQPDLITVDQKMTSGLGSCKVNWTFAGGKIRSEFIFKVHTQVQLDQIRYVMPLGAPHTSYRIGTTFCLGAESLRAEVEQDDFQATWKDVETVSEDPAYASYYGNIHYLQTLSRDHAFVMRPGQQYKLVISFEPDVRMADA